MWIRQTKNEKKLNSFLNNGPFQQTHYKKIRNEMTNATNMIDATNMTMTPKVVDQMLADNLSLYIPNIRVRYDGKDKEMIARHFRHIGRIKSIDLEPKMYRGEYSKWWDTFIHFHEWFVCEESVKLYSLVKDNAFEARLYLKGYPCTLVDMVNEGGYWIMKPAIKKGTTRKPTINLEYFGGIRMSDYTRDLMVKHSEKTIPIADTLPKYLIQIEN